MIPEYNPKTDLEIKNNYTFYPGCHTVKSPVIGSRADELATVKRAMDAHPILYSLEKAIYQDHLIHIIPLDKMDLADAASRYLFLEYIKKYASEGCDENNIVQWSDRGFMGLLSNKTCVHTDENDRYTWHVSMIVEARHDQANEKYGKYLPPHIVAYHELMHGEEIVKNSPKKFRQPGDELLTTIKTFILLDEVYKTIHGIREDEEVDYGQSIEIKDYKVALGHFANVYRELERKFGTLYIALLSSDSLSFLAEKFPVTAKKPFQLKSSFLERSDSRSNRINRNLAEPSLEDLNGKIEKAPGNIQFRLSRAELLYRKRRFEEALKDYQFVIEKYPSNYEAKMGIQKCSPISQIL